MKIRSLIGFILCVCIATVLVACAPQPEQETISEATTTTRVTITTVPLIDEVLTDMITKEEISAALGVEMNTPTLAAQGTVLSSVNADQTVMLSVEVDEKPRDVFEQNMMNFSSVKACPNLGDVAWYSSEYHQLLLYGAGFMMTVEARGIEMDETEEMLAYRQIAALILEHLENTQDVAE